MIQSAIDSVLQYLHGLYESKLFVCGVILALMGGAVRKISLRKKSKIHAGPDGRFSQDDMLDRQSHSDWRDFGTILVVIGIVLLAFKFGLHHVLAQIIGAMV